MYLLTKKLNKMKKLFFAVAAIAVMSSVTSCKKCGYCKYQDGSNSSAVCNNATLNAFGLDEYKEAQTQCSADNGTWQKE